MNRTFKSERQQKFKHNYNYADNDEIFYKDSHHEWAFVGGPMKRIAPINPRRRMVAILNLIKC